MTDRPPEPKGAPLLQRLVVWLRRPNGTDVTPTQAQADVLARIKFPCC